MEEKNTYPEEVNQEANHSSLLTPHSSFPAPRPALQYIPQRPPFVMIDALLYCDTERTETEFTILPDNLFVENGLFTEMGVLENVAQTCAARLGFLNADQPVKIGMIGSVDNLEFFQAPKVGEKIRTKILVTAEVFNVVMLTATVARDDETMATCSMKVVLTEVDSEE